jgi:GNAT superfamily N-acetyltransferase
VAEDNTWTLFPPEIASEHRAMLEQPPRFPSLAPWQILGYKDLGGAARWTVVDRDSCAVHGIAVVDSLGGMEARAAGVPEQLLTDPVLLLRDVEARPRGCGAGSVLVQLVLAQADKRGCTVALQRAAADGDDARLRAFFESFGFEALAEVGEALMVRAPKQAS